MYLMKDISVTAIPFYVNELLRSHFPYLMKTKN